MKNLLALILFLFFSIQINAQNYLDWDSYNVDEIYENIDLDYGTLDKDGDDIDHIYVRVDLKKGAFEVEISDETGDLFYIEGTNYYLEFTSYYGYAYQDEGVLVVNNYGGATFYKDDHY